MDSVFEALIRFARYFFGVVEISAPVCYDEKKIGDEAMRNIHKFLISAAGSIQFYGACNAHFG